MEKLEKIMRECPNVAINVETHERCCEVCAGVYIKCDGSCEYVKSKINEQDA